MPLTRHRRNHYIREILSVTALWTVIALLCVYFKFNDIPEDTVKRVYGFAPWMTRIRLYELAFLIGLSAGLLMGLAHTFLYPLIVKTRSFFINVLLRLFVFLFLSVAILALFAKLCGFSIFHLAQSGGQRSDNSFLDVFVYLVLVEIIVGLNVTIRKNLGKDYINKLIHNAYFTPKEEYRVFMFTDLKNSTGLVEEMGSLFFSRFIQECFRDFSEAALDCGAEIYQFVGDEAVTTWKIGKNFDYTDCISLHLRLCSRLQAKRDFYEDSFGTFPEFRSSIHSGKVSAALVGTYKSEIAYHGGVLNLCARLQSVCRDLETDLILSRPFYNNLPDNVPFTCVPVTDVELKGFSVRQQVYKVIIPS